MAYLSPHFVHDVFVSFSHGDPRTGNGPLKKWTFELLHDLEDHILAINPEFLDLDIWRDEKLDPTLQLTPELKARVKSSGILFIVMSPHYMKSRRCNDELTWFREEIRDRAQDSERVFIIRALRTDASEWPEFLRDERGFAPISFYFHHPQNDTPYHWAGSRENDDEYLKCLGTLRTTLTKRLRELRDRAQTLAEINRLIEEPRPPAPVENVPSAVSFGWTSKGTITIVAGAQNWPVFPFKGGQQDHANRLEASRALATDTVRSLRSGKWNARSDYAEILDQYAAYLPKQPEEGNFLLADAEARVIRSMFAAEQDILPVPLAAKLKVLLEQHIGLRAYYPATEEFYESVRSGHLETPLPMDAVEGFIHGVKDNSPTFFEPTVADILENTAQPIPAILPVDLQAPKSDIAQPAPPPDPLGEVDLEKSRRFTLGSAVNALWKAVRSGDEAGKTVEGWSKVIATLGPNVVPILDWLRSVL